MWAGLLALGFRLDAVKIKRLLDAFWFGRSIKKCQRVCVCVCVFCIYGLCVEQGHSLMFQMFPKAGSGGRDQTLEAPPVLRFHGDGVGLEGRD